MPYELLHNLTRIPPHDTEASLGEFFQGIDQRIPLRLATLWNINPNANTASVCARYGYAPAEIRESEHVRELDNSFMGAALAKIVEKQLPYLDMKALLSSSFFGDRLAADTATRLSLDRVIVIPIYDLQAVSGLRITSLLNLYPGAEQDIDDRFIDAIRSSLSNLLLALSLSYQARLTDEVLRIYAEHTHDIDLGHMLDAVVNVFVKDFVKCESVSVLTWSRHRSCFLLDWSMLTRGASGRHECEDSVCVAIRNGGGAEVDHLLGRKLQDHVVVSQPGGIPFSVAPHSLLESRSVAPKSILAVPIRSMSRDARLLGLLRLVNKINRLGPVIDYFDVNDVRLTKQITRLLSFFLEAVRHERERAAYTLQMAHELLAPSVAVEGSSDRLIRHWQDYNKLPNFKRLSYLNSIRDHAKLQITLTRSIQYGWKSSNYPKAVQYRVRKTNIGEIVEKAKRIVIPICRSEGITFDNIKIRAPFPSLALDEDAFCQVFFNMLTNAIKYRKHNDPDSFAIEVRSEPITDAELSDQLKERLGPYGLADSRDGFCGYIVSVMDNGIGVRAQNVERIFDVGFREEGTEQWSVRGSGIGLSVVRKIQADFHSRVWLETPRDPTLFEIFLPRILLNDDYVKSVTWQGPSRSTGQPKRR